MGHHLAIAMAHLARSASTGPLAPARCAPGPRQGWVGTSSVWSSGAEGWEENGENVGENAGEIMVNDYAS